MAAIVEINSVVFEQMKGAYSRKFDGSALKLVKALNAQEPDESEFGGQNAIADRTIRNVFSSKESSKESHQETPKVRLRTLNRLCLALLDCTYEEALSSVPMEKKQPIFSGKALNLSEDWLFPYRDRVTQKCSTIRVLDMIQPIDLGNIFTQVNILEESRRQKQRTLEQVLGITPSAEQAVGRIKTKQTGATISGLDAVRQYRKLLILGKPGSGKTTFLKYLSLKCLSGNIFGKEKEEELLPIYVPLKDFSEDESKSSLANETMREMADVIPDSDTTIESWLKDGRCLILLDALDEIITTEVDRVYRSIDDLIRRYPKNRFIITCRTEASSYMFKDFFVTEIADFNEEQISTLVEKWFASRSKPEMGQDFLRRIKETPAIAELATNPLLLTNLCLVFEDFYAPLPSNLNGLLDDAVEIFLRRWDATRRIARRVSSLDKLSLPRRLDLFSEIAYHAFREDPKRYGWHKWDLDSLIRRFIQDVEGVSSKTLDLDVKALLEDIESNNGLIIRQAKDLYTFSHLTFQEFFTARYIAGSFDPNLIREVVAQHLTDRQWHEVFIILAGRLTKSDDLLRQIFLQANALIKDNESLQQMLSWLDKVTTESQVISSSWRAGYLAVDLDITLYVENAIEIDRTIAQKLSTTLRNFNKKEERIIPRTPKADIELSLGAVHALAVDYASSKNFQPNETLKRDHSISNQQGAYAVRTNGFDEYDQKFLGLQGIFDLEKKFQKIIEVAEDNDYSDLVNELISLEETLPTAEASKSAWKEWADELQSVMLRQLDVGYEIHFSEQDIKSLEDYLYACTLLLECIQAGSRLSRELRDSIIDSILLPQIRLIECDAVFV